MKPAATTAQIDELLASQGWMKRLATSLVGSEAAAEDLVQEAWIAALRSPPDEGRPVRPWLRQVLRNLARMRWRGDERRAVREQAMAPAAPEPTPEDLAARVATQRRLADLVLALDEPLRRVVLLRYVEGLSSTEIGSREGLPPGTVRWRVKRALELVRERLDRDADGDRRTWQLAMVPIVTAPGTAPAKAGLIAGAITVTTTKIITATAVTAAVVVAAVALGRDRAGAAPPPAASLAAAPSAAAPPAAGADTPGPALDSRGPRRFASAGARARLEQEIAGARERREAAARAATARPSLPAASPATSSPPPNLTATPDYGKDYIRERVRELIPLMTECYTMALERDPTLEGTVVVEMTLVGEPEVGGLVGTSEVDPEASTLLEDGFSECIRETMYALEIDPPPDGGTVRVRYPFEFRPG